MNADSRILTISSSLNYASSLLARLHPSIQPSSESTIPWTISNKYYVADVHFELRASSSLSSHHLDGVPAILFVWSHGQAWRNDAMALFQMIKRGEHEPEVVIAIRGTPSPSGHKNNSGEEAEEDEEDQAAIDDYLSSLGFEFVDEYEASASRSEVSIPSLPRAIDALSTIMWPTMQTRGKSTSVDLTPTATSFADEDYLSHKPFADPDMMQAEIEELVQWLEGGEGTTGSDPWKISSSQNIAISPTDIQSTDSFSGFDDDFSAFVTAPSRDTNISSSDISDSQSTLADDGLGLSAYASLASVSDFREAREDPDEPDVEDKDMFPSKAEILETSAQIFGWPPPSYGAMSASALTDSNNNHDTSLHDANHEPNFEAFDFSQVLSTLEGMKAQIASMDNESEKHKMAARVALGLVYGAGFDNSTAL